MKKLDDEEIQRLLEQKLSPVDNKLIDGSRDDINAYRVLFESLEKEPVTGLPYNFSKKVAAQVQLAASRRQERKWYFYITLVILVAFAAIYGYMALFNYKGTQQLVNIIDAYKWVILFILGCVLVIQYFDQKVVKRNMLPRV